MGGDRERCIAAGMDDYISKPIDKDLLKVKINHWLRTEVVYESHKLRRKYLRPNSNMTLIDGKPIDLDELEEFYGAEQMNQMMSMFISDTSDMLQRIRPQMFERHARGVAGLAHEVKASCASIGAKQLARLCLYLEQAVGQQDWIEAEETLRSLERSFETLKNYVESQIQEESSVSP
jgi:HPt (histidine-containing phosphotransfer) domain-containing protein